MGRGVAKIIHVGLLYDNVGKATIDCALHTLCFSSSIARLSLEKNDRAAAAAVLDEAIESEPNNAHWLLLRGKVFEDSGEHAKAITDYESAIDKSPDEPPAYQRLAWVLATSPQAKLRDGDKALKHAMRFLELHHDRDWNGLATVAAAFAENGKFDAAVVAQQESLKFAPPNVKGRLKHQLQHYHAQRPLRTQLAKTPSQP